MLFLRYESCSLWKTLLWLWNVINLCLSVKWDSISWWFFLFTSMSILTNYCIIFWLYHFINRESLSPWNYFNLATYYWNAYIKPGEWAGMNAYMYVYTGNRLCLFSFFFTIFWLDVATVLTMWYFFFNFISKFQVDNAFISQMHLCLHLFLAHAFICSCSVHSVFYLIKNQIPLLFNHIKLYQRYTHP